jgi:predicted amidohydrolase YtcJ
MAKLTRADFLRESGILLAGMGLGQWPVRAEAAQRAATAPGTGAVQLRAPGVRPDLVVVNARVFTVDDAMPRAEAFAVKNGRFIAVGSSSDIRNLVAPGTEVIDAEGMTVTPGFIDLHVHPFSGGVNGITAVDLDLRSIADIKGALRQRAQRTAPDGWVQGFKYDDTKVRDGRQIRVEDLDEAVPDHPVFISHRGGHVYWLNSRALELAGITVETPDPPGGMIYRENGKLTGKIAENAVRLVRHVVPSGSTREQRQAGVKLISEQMTASGLTTVSEGGTGYDAIVAFQDAYRAGEMRFRLSMMVSDRNAQAGFKAAGIRSGFGDEHLWLGGFKFSADGSASGRTMYMSTPYVGRPDDFGILTMTPEEIMDAVADAHSHGYQIEIHANGDKAIEYVLDAYEAAQAKWPRPDPRHRIEHATLMNPTLLRRIRDLGVVPEPFTSYVHYHGDKWAEYGEERMKSMFAFRSFLDYGIQPAFGSDYVPGPFEPLMGLQSMVTRKDTSGRVWGANQKVTVAEALRIGTLNGARGLFMEDRLGSITAGKYADFVIFARDPHEVDPDSIKEIPVVRTVVQGRTVHAA